jgi:hypothetical protein
MSDRQLTSAPLFLDCPKEEQEEWVLFLQEKRKILQAGRKKAPKKKKVIKLPSFEFTSQGHKLCYLGLPPVYQKLFR